MTDTIHRITGVARIEIQPNGRYELTMTDGQTMTTDLSVIAVEIDIDNICCAVEYTK